jgi:ABC-type transporter Mla subunit MlaD
MMSRRALDLWVGFFALLGIAAMMFLALQVASSATLAARDGYRVNGQV